MFMKNQSNTIFNILIGIAIILILGTVFVAWKYPASDMDHMMMEGDMMDMEHGDMPMGDMKDEHSMMDRGMDASGNGRVETSGR